MESKKLLMSVVAVFALVLLLSNVSALVQLRSVEIDGVGVYPEYADLSSLPGSNLPVKVIFYSNENYEDVRVKAWIAGSSGLSESTERFDLIAERQYVRYFSLSLPEKVDPEESLKLRILVENQDGELLDRSIDLTVQRENYRVEVLDVDMDSRVQTGEKLALDVVLKNRGRNLAEDTFVRISIPALGVEKKAYFEDLAPVDQSETDEEVRRDDSAERRVYLDIPSSAKPGIYTLEIEVFSEDSSSTITRKIVVVGASADSIVIAPVKVKTFATGATAEYTITLVNSGNKVQVYEVVSESPTGLVVVADEPIVAVPAGTSKTVKVYVTASQAGTYDFAVSVMSSGDLVKKEALVANVEGTRASGTSSVAQNTTVLLTVVLAIIFVVLLVVLIVLLTRKPEKAKEFGESYY
jgi:hypothetical protein